MRKASAIMAATTLLAVATWSDSPATSRPFVHYWPQGYVSQVETNTIVLTYLATTNMSQLTGGTIELEVIRNETTGQLYFGRLDQIVDGLTLVRVEHDANRIALTRQVDGLIWLPQGKRIVVPHHTVQFRLQGAGEPIHWEEGNTKKLNGYHYLLLFVDPEHKRILVREWSSGEEYWYGPKD